MNGKAVLVALPIVFIFFVTLMFPGAASLAALADGTNYYVDATLGDDVNSGAIDQPWQTISKVVGMSFAPGDRIHFKRGEVWDGEYLHISVNGAADAPIVFQAYGEGANPRIENASISISGAAYAVVRDFDVSGSGYAGIGIQQGSHHITVTRNVVHHNASGIWLGNGVGMNNVVSDNEVYLNAGNGIAVDTVFCTPGNETIISGNRVYSNVWHGMELSANYHIIEQNVVYDNGENPDGSDDIVGHSGIHFFSRYHANEEDKGGDHNIVRYNIVYDNRDNEPSATDGNGIQMDMWCDNNLVYDNIAYGNDGPGIISYGGSNNQIYNNTLFDNAQHLGWRLAQTQLMIASSDEVPAANNLIANNIAYSQDANAYAVFIEEDARSRGNTFTHNLWYNESGGNLIGRGWDGNINLAQWNAESWADDFSDDPLFVNGASKDFQLRSSSPAIDMANPASVPDDDFITVSRPQGSASDIGAYEYQFEPVYVPVLQISPLDQQDVRISWEHNDHCARYDIWRDGAPYFDPLGDATHTAIEAPWQWADDGVRGDPEVNYFYVARCAHYNQSVTSSNRVGVFDFALIAGATP
jgi:parallel beta-helix repeat protein